MPLQSPAIVQRFTKLLRGAAAASLILTALLPRSAGANPIDDKRHQADQLAAQISALGDKESALAERYNQATLNAASVQAKVNAANARLAQANAAAAAAKGQLVGAAVDAYIQGTPSSTSGLAADGDPAVARVYTAIVSSRGTEALDQVRATTLQVKDEQSQLAVAQRSAQAALADIAARRKDVQT